MQQQVIRAVWTNHQVIAAIVRSILVEVMNLFRAAQFSTQRTFSYMDMLHDGFATHPKDSIAI